MFPTPKDIARMRRLGSSSLFVVLACTTICCREQNVKLPPYVFHFEPNEQEISNLSEDETALYNAIKSRTLVGDSAEKWETVLSQATLTERGESITRYLFALRSGKDDKTEKDVKKGLVEGTRVMVVDVNNQRKTVFQCGFVLPTY